VFVGDAEYEVTAGDVIVAPARVQHEVHAAADEALDTIVAMAASLKTFGPDGSELDQPWKR
jgi:quercetin dioxygenase-like cupin family protein